MDEEAILMEALSKIDPVVRESYLNEACSNDESLRKNVESLIKAHERAGSFLNQPAEGFTLPERSQPISVEVGTQIGPYKLREQLGEGGMGMVYAAEQEHPVRRKVALKLIKPGMDSREVIGRFEAERQSLAMMDHQNIARVLDAGTTEAGLPYFVMELVRGVTVTEYCDKNRLSVRQRLELFTQICKAVQHAHQKGIIHRDIKPSNVMITLHDGLPVPKVIDFGVAKAINQRLTEGTVYTKVAQMLGTPAYMSPEQAELSGLDVDTRSDIYSLGVLLYELLTGSTPFTKEQLSDGSFDEMRRVIRETDPQRPSERVSTLQAEAISTVANRRSKDPRTLANSLRGELDWIVMKALEKDRTRRYETASGMAADVQRFLSDEPVIACPPSTLYRFRKFVRRNKVVLAFSILVCIASLAAIVGLAISNQMITQREKKTLLAQKETREVNKRMKTINDFVLTNIVQSANPLSKDGSRDITVRDSLLAANDLIDDTFQDDPILRSHVKANFGDYLKSIGEYTAARKSLEDALSVYVQEYGKRNSYSIDTMRTLTQVYRQQQELDLALSNAKEVIALTKAAFGKHDREAISALYGLCSVLVGQRQFSQCEDTAREVIEFAQAGEFPLYEALGNQVLGIIRFNQQQYQDAEWYWDRAMVMFEELGSRPNITSTKFNIANVYWETGRQKESIALRKQILEDSTVWYGPTHPDTLYALRGLAYGRAGADDIDGAVKDLRLLLERTRSKYGPQHWRTAKAMRDVGKALRQTGEFAETIELQNEALRIEIDHYGKNHPEPIHTLEALALSYKGIGDIENSSRCFREAIDAMLAIASDHPENLRNIVSLGGAYCNFGNLLREEMQQLTEAVDCFSEAIRILEPVQTNTGRKFLVNNYISRAETMEMMERWQKAIGDAEKAVLNATNPRRKNVMLLLKARLLAQSGDDDESILIVDDALTRTEDAECYFLAARVLALCAGKESADTLSTVVDDEFVSRSIQLLKQADQAGYFRYPNRIAEIRECNDFDQIRKCAEFKSFVKQIASDDQK